MKILISLVLSGVLVMPFSKQTGAQMASLTINGKLIGGGVECPAMMGDDDQLYSLIGNMEGFVPGQRVTVKGDRVAISHCRRGTAINVRSIRPADTQQREEAPASKKQPR